MERERVERAKLYDNGWRDGFRAGINTHRGFGFIAGLAIGLAVCIFH